MNRNSLVVESLRKPDPAGRSVWAMTLTLLGAAFGAAPRRREPIR